MIDLIQITNDPELAARCDALPGMRLMVDLEQLGKAQRQAGRDTLISVHSIGDIAAVKSVLRASRLMVRVNPLHDGTPVEVDAALSGGADLLMLPMFTDAAQLRAFLAIVAGRCGVVPLLETAGALDTLDDWIALDGLAEVFAGLNDLHLQLRMRFMFEPLAAGIVDRVAAAARARGLRFGFGGIARVGEGLLPGEDVLAEHLRLGSGAVILSRTFYRGGAAQAYEEGIAQLRGWERRLAARDPGTVEADRLRVAAAIAGIAAAARDGSAGSPR